MPFLLLALILTGVANAQYTIHTFAGGGSLDGWAATKVSLRNPMGVAVAPSGDIYVSDNQMNQVFKVSSAGTIATVAGNGYRGYSGDGGPALKAALSGPQEIALDAAGNLYILDSANSRIRKVTPAGIITTLAGNGETGNTLDGIPAANTPIAPLALTADSSGNVFIAERSRIRKVAPNGIISTVAGNGYQGFSGDGGPATSASFNEPQALALDQAGNLYIADSGNCRIRKVATNGIIATIAGTYCLGYSGDGGPAIQAVFHAIEGLTVDAAGNVYISDSANYRVRKIGTNGIVNTIAGVGMYGYPDYGSQAANTYITYIRQLALDSSGSLYLADPYAAAIHKVSPSGVISPFVHNTTWGTAWESGPATRTQISGGGLNLDPAGNLYFSTPASIGSYTPMIRKISPTGAIVPTVPLPLYGGPIAFDQLGNAFVADRYRIRKVSPAGVVTDIAGTGQTGYSGDGGPAVNASIALVTDLAVNPDGVLFIADAGNSRIRKVSSSGIITTIAGNGNKISSGDGGLATAASLSNPTGIVFDTAGILYILESTSNKIRRVLPDGAISSVAQVGGGGGPAIGLARDKGGNFYTTYNGQVLKVLPSGAVVSIAGGQNQGFSEDGTAALGAPLSSPSDIAVDDAGNIYFNEYNTPNGDRIRVLRPALTAEPSSLTFRYVTGTQLPPSRTITASLGSTPLAVNASVYSGAVWLSVAPSSSSTPASFQINVDPSSLSVGSYSGGILLSANGISTLVPVTLTVEAYCTYSLVPSSYSAGAGPSSGFLGIAVNPTCSWTAVSNDSWIILTSPASGIGSSPVTFQLQANNGPARTGSITIAGQSSLIHQAAAPGVTTGYRFVPVVPCRLLDTRLANGPFGGPRLQANETRSFTLPATNCGVPANAAAYSLNATVVPAGRLSYLTLWPSGQSQPHVSTLNSFDGRIKANAAIVPAGTAGAVSVFATDPTDVVLDINGYFIPAAAGGSSFYSVPYCRMYFQSPLDPSLSAGETKTFTRYCVPTQPVTAYSLNVSVKPAGPLGFLTLWSADQPQPFVSTLNSPTGTVTSNAAIVAVGASGAINAFVTNTSGVSLFLNGFFGTPGFAGEQLFHPVKPCRIADTRLDQGPLGGPALLRVMPRSFPVPLSSCGIPSTARSYSLNVTLVPIEATAQVTLGPGAGVAFTPYPFLLESLDGSVVSSAAIIPADSNAGIGAWAFQTTHLILDINGYFE